MKRSDFRSTFKPRTAISLAISALMAGVVAAACQQTTTSEGASPSAEGSPAAESPAASGGGGGLKLGALLPATGDLSSIGQPMLKALPLIVETVNACGGVNGSPVTLAIEDDQTDPAAGTE